MHDSACVKVSVWTVHMCLHVRIHGCQYFSIWACLNFSVCVCDCGIVCVSQRENQVVYISLYSGDIFTGLWVVENLIRLKNCTKLSFCEQAGGRQTNFFIHNKKKGTFTYLQALTTKEEAHCWIPCTVSIFMYNRTNLSECFLRNVKWPKKKQKKRSFVKQQKMTKCWEKPSKLFCWFLCMYVCMYVCVVIHTPYAFLGQRSVLSPIRKRNKRPMDDWSL